MARSSDRNPARRRDDAASDAIVVDAFEIKGSFHPSYAPGVVVVLDSRRLTDIGCATGQVVRIRTADGLEFEARVDEVRDHATTVSLYFEGRTKAEIPIGSTIGISADAKMRGRGQAAERS